MLGYTITCVTNGTIKINRKKESTMYTIIVSDTKGQRTVNFKNENLLFYYLNKINNVTLKHEDNEKIYIETSDGISYEYFKLNEYETYLFYIFPYYFDTDELNKDKWFYDGEGDWFTFDKLEIAWFYQLYQAYTHLSQKELDTIPFNDYDEIIDYYNRKKAN